MFVRTCFALYVALALLGLPLLVVMSGPCGPGPTPAVSLSLSH